MLIEISADTLEERDALISQIELLMLGICFSPFILLILLIVLIKVWAFVRDPVSWWDGSLRYGVLKFLTIPIAYIYFKRKFGKDFFEVPIICMDCQLELVNSQCSECGVLETRSPYGRYVGGADAFMFEFAEYHEQSIERGRKVLEARKKQENTWWEKSPES